MNILVCGATGFIGRALCAHFERAGHSVVRGVRKPMASNEIQCDFSRDFSPEIWREILIRSFSVSDSAFYSTLASTPDANSGSLRLDAVVNAVGILSETPGQSFDAIHRAGPCALFEAARDLGVPRFIQISALGAGLADSGYFTSKLAADEFLLALPGVDARVIRPSLVYGPDGQSARVFRALASLPVHALPAGGRQPLRPVHVDDLADLAENLLRADSTPQPDATVATASLGANLDARIVDAVGATQVDYRGMLASYRSSMRFLPAWRIPVPTRLMDWAAALMDRSPIRQPMLSRNTWAMLQSAQPASGARMRAVLGRVPLGIGDFMRADGNAEACRQEALSFWRNPTLRIALAVVWLWTAFVSAFVYPEADSLALLAPLHLTGPLAVAALYGASALDFLFGLGTLFWPRRKLWLAQMALIGGYSILIAFALPQFLWHPFGPLLKNIPILAILFILLGEERKS